ncbi:HEAT repeat domain-containing protein [Cylindrospermum stagnale]|nr:HEAT repeat domain-containing protein [Cylindrospermum stagnale]
MVLATLIGIYNHDVWSIAQLALNSGFPNVRITAAFLLCHPQATAAWDTLVKALSDSDSRVRRNVAKALAILDPVLAADWLHSLFASVDENDRLTVLDIFKTFDCPPLTPAVIDALQDISPEVRAAAATALFKVGKNAIVHLETALDDPDEQVRCQVLETLYKLAADVPVSIFIQACSDSSSDVRFFALCGIARKGNLDACPTVLHLINDPRLKELAIDTLGKLGCKQAINRLLEEAEQAINDNELVAVLKTLGKIGGDEISPILRSALSKTAPMVRAASVTAYLAVNPPEAVPVLLNVLKNDSSKMVRAAAVEVLGKIGGEQVCTRLIEVLREDRDAEVRQTAAGAITNCGDSQNVEALLSGLTDSDSGVRLQIVASLGKIKLNQAIPALLELEHQETNHEILAQIADSLVRLDHTRFANKIVSGCAKQLFNPTSIGVAFTSWLLDPSYYFVSGKIIFYNNSYAETVDSDDERKEYRYTAKGDQLNLHSTGDGRELVIKFTVAPAVWENPMIGLQSCYQLTLNYDFFFNHLAHSESRFFSSFQ